MYHFLHMRKMVHDRQTLPGFIKFARGNRGQVIKQRNMNSWQTIGFEENKAFFENLINGDSISHAYLFTGEEMIGRKTFALELARLVNQREAGRIDIDPDVLVIDPSLSQSGQTIGIDEIRKAKMFASTGPLSGKRKFSIIDDAYLMTTEAQNSFLKILEEANGKTTMILISPGASLLLPTVVSRCQEIRFFPHPPELAAAVINEAGFDRQQAEFLKNISAGKIGLVKEIVKNQSLETLENDVKQFTKLTAGSINERLALAQKLTEDKNSPELKRKVLFWLLYTRTEIAKPKMPAVAQKLLGLYKSISKPQFNKRLALENFLISI